MRGRIRTIKPDIGKHEGLWDLGQETGLPVFQTFVLLWCYADKAGRFEWRPRALKTDVLPYWDGDFSRVLDALATRGFLVKYACDGREYGWIPGFPRHQVVNNRETESELPSPEESSIIPVESTRAPRVNDACPTPLCNYQGEGKGMGREWEGNGSGRVDDACEQKPPKATKATKPPKPKAEKFVPDDWQPSDAHGERAKELGVVLAIELQKFRCHEFKVPKTDWNKAFFAWLSNASQFATSSGGRGYHRKETPEVEAATARFTSMLYGGRPSSEEPVKAKVIG